LALTSLLNRLSWKLWANQPYCSRLSIDSASEV
jgi:hypothetical protein